VLYGADVAGRSVEEGSSDRGINTDLSEVRISSDRDHADGRVPVLLSLQRMWGAAKASPRRLLRVLLVRLRAVPTYASGRRLLFLEFKCP
jgi:hypothetical protein